ncbi:MAG: signal recognition particle protein [Holosporaceae bacterium]|jgi:signal recognition particle subunit SRP54|nr:signal recognition particle protein [Holosporaceae bacterium]
MFEAFSDRISGIFEKLRRSGVLKEADVETALREIRVALLEADVALDVTKKFMTDVGKKALGQDIVKSISPGQMMIKIVHDHLVELLGKSSPPVVDKKPYTAMVVGLQGAGKTTTAGKLAKYFLKASRKTALASTDVHRPAAIEQLRILAERIDGAIFAPSGNAGKISALKMTKLALETLKEENADVLVLDTAGRLQVDDVRMEELAEIRDLARPDDTFLVVDALTGQDAFNIAHKFSESIGITGIILTRMDGDARGGVALSMRAITGCEIKFLGVGERLEDLEFFDPERIADRILGMGDVVTLVEKAQQSFSQKESEEMLQKMQLGVFTFDDLADQMKKISKLGGLTSMLKMLPQTRQLNGVMEAHGVSDALVTKNIAIINSMTKKERRNHRLLNGSRKKRIANGSGTTVQDVNKLIKQYEAALDIFKKIKKVGGMNGFVSMMGK